VIFQRKPYSTDDTTLRMAEVLRSLSLVPFSGGSLSFRVESYRNLVVYIRENLDADDRFFQKSLEVGQSLNGVVCPKCARGLGRDGFCNSCSRFGFGGDPGIPLVFQGARIPRSAFPLPRSLFSEDLRDLACYLAAWAETEFIATSF